MMLIQKIPVPKDLLIYLGLLQLKAAGIIQLKTNVDGCVHAGSSSWLSTDKIIITLQVLMKKGL